MNIEDLMLTEKEITSIKCPNNDKSMGECPATGVFCIPNCRAKYAAKAQIYKLAEQGVGMMVECPHCNGKAWHTLDNHLIHTAHLRQRIPCAYCNQTGKVFQPLKETLGKDNNLRKEEVRDTEVEG